MSAWELTLRLIAGLLLILVNAFFVVTEFALTRLRQLDEKDVAADPRLRRAWKMTERLEIYLTGCQLGITSSSILMGVVAEPAVTRLITPGTEWVGVPPRVVPVVSIVLSVIVINLIHKIWGEQAPTYLGVERPAQVLRYTAAPLDWWTKVMYPAILLGDGLAKTTLRMFGVEMKRSWTRRRRGPSEEPQSANDRPATDSFAQVRRAMGEALSRGGLPRDRQREVLRALDIDRIPVRDVMVDRQNIVAASTAKLVKENLRVMADRQRHSRFPLVGDSLEDFVGVLYVSDVFRHIDALRQGDVSLRELATPPLTVPATLPVSRLIDRFQKNRQELALVEDHGRIVGLVTVTRALEAVAGELEDPFDE